MNTYKWIVLVHKDNTLGYFCAKESLAKRLLKDNQIADYVVYNSQEEAQQAILDIQKLNL